MDTSEIHYLTYDPDEIYKDLQETWIESGGDVLYPGDEKEMGVRAMVAVLVQAFAGIDNGLRMATLRYAIGKYLDLYGEKRLCYRMEAQRAKATVEIKLRATGRSGTIAAGTLLTADGSYLYSMDEDISFAGYQQTILAQITANEAGSAGNGLLAGTQMQLLASAGAVESVYCVVSASGGQEREKDEIYKERIRTHGTAPVTTGTKAQYEAAAKSVSSEILDARALEADACKVCVYILLAHDEGAAAIIENVETALSKVDERPMTDQVSVSQAQSVGYTLNVRYKFEPGGNFTTALAEVVKAYQLWQEAKIGRAFNPDKLVSELYRAGAARVVLDAGSEFNGGPAEWTEIAENQWCKGTITLGVLT